MTRRRPTTAGVVTPVVAAVVTAVLVLATNQGGSGLAVAAGGGTSTTAAPSPEAPAAAGDANAAAGGAAPAGKARGAIRASRSGAGDDDALERAINQLIRGGGGRSIPLPPAPYKVAEALGNGMAVYDSPGAAEPSHVFSNPNESGAWRVALVVGGDDQWLEVLLPVRPNGTTGWVKAADVNVAKHSFRVLVDRAGRHLTAWAGDEVIADVPAGIGTRSTPTPAGLYYVTELLRPPDPRGPYGPYAFGLSGYSDVLTKFGGGKGVIGIHGTNQPSSLGKTASHGCIRIANDVITHLAGILPLGTPVVIA